MADIDWKNMKKLWLIQACPSTSCDKCSQAIPVFYCSSNSMCKYKLKNKMEKDWEGG